jgi:hypothetical protein
MFRQRISAGTWVRGGAALVAVLLAAGVPFRAQGAERIVLGEYFGREG